jgi:hypothetical protein
MFAMLRFHISMSCNDLFSEEKNEVVINSYDGIIVDYS